MSPIFRLLVLLWLACTAIAGMAAPPDWEPHDLMPDATQDGRPYVKHVYWYEDPTRSLSAEAIRADALDRFTRINGPVINLRQPSGTLWLYVPLAQLTGNQSPFLRYLVMDSQLHAPVNLFLDRGLQRLEQKPFTNRQIDNKPLVFTSNKIAPLQIDASLQGVLLQVDTSERVRFALGFWTPDAIQGKEIQIVAFNSIALGVISVMLLYNTLIVLTMGSRLHLMYVLFVSTLGLLMFTYSGHTNAYLWPDARQWIHFNIPFLLTVVSILGMEFSRRFLDCANYTPRLNRLVTAVIVLSILLLLSIPFLSGRPAMLLAMTSNALATALMLSAAIGALLRGYYVARFIAVAWFSFLVGGIVESLLVANRLPPNFVTDHSSSLASLAAIMFFSLGMADQFIHWLQTNIREQKQSRDQLQTANHELSATMAKLAQSNRVKDQFLATISHELRTPMNGVEGSLDLIGTENLTRNQLNYMLSARQSAREMTNLIDAILRFSEIQSGQVSINQELFEIRPALHTAAVKFKYECQRKGLELNWYIDKSLPMFIRFDYDNLLLITRQLVDNAIKFTEQGRVSVDVKLVEDAQDQSALQLTVADTGQGIPKRQLRNIFDAFHQLDNDFNRRHRGLGIGLAICHQLAVLMGGRLEAQSEVGIGTTMTVTLPVTLPSQRELDALDNQRDQDTRQKTVLVAEDNPVNQMVLKAMLQELGCFVLTVDNGQEVLDLLARHPVDLVMMDCQMPHIDGFEATERIRRSGSSWQDIPIIAVTANAMTGDSIRCLTAGMNDYIKKPINRELLQEKVRRWLKIEVNSAA